MIPAEIGVDTQPITIAVKVRLLKVRAPFTSPIPATPPTIAWDDETGTPTWVKSSTVTAAESAAINAAYSSRDVIFLPTVIITFLLYVSTPAAMLRPPMSTPSKGVSSPEPT